MHRPLHAQDPIPFRIGPTDYVWVSSPRTVPGGSAGPVASQHCDVHFDTGAGYSCVPIRIVPCTPEIPYRAYQARCHPVPQWGAQNGRLPGRCLGDPLAPLRASTTTCNFMQGRIIRRVPPLFLDYIIIIRYRLSTRIRQRHTTNPTREGQTGGARSPAVSRRDPPASSGFTPLTVHLLSASRRPHPSSASRHTRGRVPAAGSHFMIREGPRAPRAFPPTTSRGHQPRWR